MTLYAKWNNPAQPDEPGVTEYTVRFDSNGGSAVQNQKIKSGGRVAVPQAPTRSGYEFVCWCADSALGTAWNFAVDTVSSNITLYAKWNEIGGGGVLKITVTNGTETVVAFHNFTASAKTVSQSGTAVYGGSTLGAYGSAIYKI